MNLTITLEERAHPHEEILRHTSFRDGKEFKVAKRVDSVLIRLGPYDNSDAIEIKHVDNEVCVLVYEDGGAEILYSNVEEQP